MDVATIISTAFGVVAAVAAGVVAIQYSTLATLRATAEDLRGRVGDLESERDRLASQVGILTADRDALGRQMRGDEQWVRITTQLTKHNEQADSHWVRELELLRDMQALMRHIDAVLTQIIVKMPERDR